MENLTEFHDQSIEAFVFIAQGIAAFGVSLIIVAICLKLHSLFMED